MNNFLKSYWAIALLIMFIVITLFPPFNWYLSSSLASYIENDYKANIGNILPIKSYEFIFSSSQKTETYNRIKWFNRSGESNKIYVPLQRKLIFHEIILNYILSSLIMLLFYFLCEKIKLRKE